MGKLAQSERIALRVCNPTPTRPTLSAGVTTVIDGLCTTNTIAGPAGSATTAGVPAVAEAPSARCTESVSRKVPATGAVPAAMMTAVTDCAA